MSSRLMHSKEEQRCLWMQLKWWSWIMDRPTVVHFGMVLSVKLTSNLFLPPHTFIITYFLHMSLDRVHLCTSCQLTAGSGCSRVPRQWSEGVSYQSTFQFCLQLGLELRTLWFSAQSPTDLASTAHLQASLILLPKSSLCPTVLKLEAAKTFLVAVLQLWNQPSPEVQNVSSN